MIKQTTASDTYIRLLRWFLAWIGGGLLVACAPPSEASLPTAVLLPSATPAPNLARASLALDATPVPSAAPVPTVAPSATPASQLEQYRLWVEEARAMHPYAESVEQMWAVMMCESEGQAEIVGLYQGLFQYHPDTWAGAWNPYRDQPILDPRAQIFATAKAWQEGYQSWWGCYGRV